MPEVGQQIVLWGFCTDASGSKNITRCGTARVKAVDATAMAMEVQVLKVHIPADSADSAALGNGDLLASLDFQEVRRQLMLL